MLQMHHMLLQIAQQKSTSMDVYLASLDLHDMHLALAGSVSVSAIFVLL